MHNAFLGVKSAQIEWRESLSQGETILAPYSTLFDDTYFNSQNPLEDSDYVFLQGNNLEERFNKLSNKAFTIFETGFGTGLNFLLTCELWREAKKETTNTSELHYYSIEQFPMLPQDLLKTYQQLGIENSPEAIQLLKLYPYILPGIYKLKVAEDIYLHFIFSSIKSGLKELAVQQNFKVDAWFLDGHAPSKNPQMWDKALLHFMALYASPETSVATFTAISELRRQLGYYGFEVSKRKGFGAKREMITAQFVEKKLSKPKDPTSKAYLSSSHPVKKVAIIGAGLAGCTTANALQLAGIEVHIFDKGSEPASGASKIPAILATPNLSIDHNPFSQLTFAGFKLLQNYCHQYCPELIDATQVLQCQSDKYSIEQLKEYLDIYGERLLGNLAWKELEVFGENIEGLMMPAIQVNGKAFCQHLLSSIPVKQQHYNQDITDLSQFDNFDRIVIATGHESIINDLGLNLPQVNPIRGQVSCFDAKSDIPLPINYQGQMFQYKDQLIAGATFEQTLEQAHSVGDDLKNIELANQKFQLNLTNDSITQSHTGIRASSYDRFPFVGTLNDTGKIWLNYGYGTRGLCLSMLGAEIIAASFKTETIDLEKNILSRLSPQRLTT